MTGIKGSVCSNIKEIIMFDDNENKYTSKRYLHFDRRVSLNQKIKNYLSNPDKIARHAFYPFIYFSIEFKKFDKKKISSNENPVKHKERKIMYASHLDNFIYKYYAKKLNDHYNFWLEENNLDECSIAYRNNKVGKSSIHFSAEVINTICKFKECYIIVGDFKDFFGSLNHQLLKQRLLNVMQYEKLPNDWYNLFKSVTKYSFYKKSTLESELGKNKKFTYFESAKDFREFKKKHKMELPNKTSGIPQGTAISAVMANVYASSLDKDLYELSLQYGGVYRRYSDDFIIIIPKYFYSELELPTFVNIKMEVLATVERNGLKIHSDKTDCFYYSETKIVDLKELKFSKIDYLGFQFDGLNVQMREKSVYKFYRKASSLIERGHKMKVKKELKKPVYRRSIYRLYTDLGIEAPNYGNFISYAKKAQFFFDRISPTTTNLMLQQIENRKKKIEKMLGYKIHTKI